MLKRAAMTVLLSALAIGFSVSAIAAELHDEPFEFLFGNDIDTHQETRLEVNEDTGEPQALFGKFYIIFTGEVDEVSGLPKARHPRGASHDEVCGVDVDCVEGWSIRALPGEAIFLYHSGVFGNDHPVWLLELREQIPQPGSPSHFHWVNSTSSDARADTVPDVCDQQNAGELEAAGAAGETCPGWFLEIKAKRSFAFMHGGQVIPVRPGIDLGTHLNIVTNYSAVDIDDPGGGGGGGHGDGGGRGGM